jgi:hypothetical protein
MPPVIAAVSAGHKLPAADNTPIIYGADDNGSDCH